MAALCTREEWRGAKEGDAKELKDKWFGGQWVSWGLKAVRLVHVELKSFCEIESC